MKHGRRKLPLWADIVIGTLLLWLIAFKVGLSINSEKTPTTFTEVPVIHLTVMSSRMGYSHLMVRDTKTGNVAEIESYGSYHDPEFADGESVDMEVWVTEEGTRPDYVYRPEDGKSTSYHESSWGGDVLGKPYEK